MNFNGAIKTEPVPKVETGITRELTPKRGPHVKIEEKPSLDEDDDIIFAGTRSLSSAPAPGRCSCGGLCNHDAAVTSAPTPAPAPAPEMALERKPVVSSFRTLEVISLISDSEDDNDFPSPPTRKGKECARAQPRFPLDFFSGPVMDEDGCPTFPTRKEKKRSRAQPNPSSPIVIKDDEDEEKLPSAGIILKRAGAHSCCLILKEANDYSRQQLLCLLFPSPSSRPVPSSSSSGTARLVPEWPSEEMSAKWLLDLKGVYNTDPEKFYLHIDAWHEQMKTKIRVFRVDDYSDWVALNYGQYRPSTSQMATPEVV